jgi:hypothetical protein
VTEPAAEAPAADEATDASASPDETKAEEA